MDLSAVIFVVLAVAWALYLIPKALKHHDEMASDRLVEGHSDRVRVLARRGRARTEVVEEVVEEVVVETPAETTAPDTAAAPAEVVAEVPVRRSLPTRAAAKRAARNRRRVLGVLLLSTAVVGVLSYLGYVPAWSPAIPGGLVVLFLVVARFSVRAQQKARRAPVARTEAPAPLPAPVSAPQEAEVFTAALIEDTSGLDRQEIEAALADDGSLWDPLPMTLPTYVNKARARRTVRTIELTGMTSSGHDSTDTALAREAEEKAKESAAAEQVEPRKAAGA